MDLDYLEIVFHRLHFPRRDRGCGEMLKVDPTNKYSANSRDFYKIKVTFLQTLTSLHLLQQSCVIFMRNLKSAPTKKFLATPLFETIFIKTSYELTDSNTLLKLFVSFYVSLNLQITN